MKPRVVILSTFLTPFRSGAEACSEEVAVRLCESYDITIITARLQKSLPKKDTLQGKVAVRRVGFGYGFDKWLFPFLAPLAARRNKPVLIHAVLETFAGLALHFTRILTPRAKRLLTLQTTNRSFLKGAIILSPHKVTAISSALVSIAEGFGRNDVTQIPNGVPLNVIRYACEKHKKVPGRIVFVGRLEEMKGIDVLLKAMSRVIVETRLRRVSTHDVTLHIVGDGSERQSLEQLAQELGMQDHVSFLGFMPVPDVYNEFAKAEIFCGLSRSEALGNVFIEAQAAGCAVVGTRVGGIPDIVQSGKSGILVPVDDVEEASAALTTMLTDAPLREGFIEAGKENAKEYDWGLIARRYAAEYEDLVDRG